METRSLQNVAITAGISLSVGFASCNYSKPTHQGTSMPTTQEQVMDRLKIFKDSGSLEALSEACALVESVQPMPTASLAEKKTFRTGKLTLCLVLLDFIDAKLEPDFDFSDVPALAVSPAPETGLPSGVDPSSITNAEARAGYEQAIKLNQQKAARYAFQKKLSKINRRATQQTEYHIAGTYSASREDLPGLDKLLDDTVSNGRRKASLRAFIRTLQTR